MAYVKSVHKKISGVKSSTESGIKNSSYMYSAIEYVRNTEKADLIYYSNCTQGDTAEIARQFQITRLLFNKDEKILAHHYVQSFSPEDNISTEQAHEIGKRLVDKIAPGFQVVMATHIDKDHIHNHFIINSVNPITGNKYRDNTSAIQFARKESDKLCKEYCISVIDKNNNSFKGIDQTTYQLGIKGKSWKFNLVKDLDDALMVCKNKSEFIKFMESRDYSVKYKDIHITFQKNGEKKGIRAKRLSEQFGKKYSKENIDKVLGVVPNVLPEYKLKKRTTNTVYRNEYEKLEQKYFEVNQPMTFTPSESWTMSKALFSSNPLLFTLKIIRHIFIKSKNRHYNKDKNKYLKQKPKQIISNKDIYACKCNISYKQLKSAPGETAQIKIYAWQLPKLVSQPFFYHSFINVNTGIATVYLKYKDLSKLAKALELTDEKFFVKQSESIINKKVYKQLKSENSNLSHLVITNDQRIMLKDNFIKFASFDYSEDKFNVVFAPQDKKRIIEILYPEKAKVKQPPKPETAYQRNGRINNKLKEEATRTGDKLRYRVVSSTQLHHLEKSDVKFATFRTEDGKNNIVFLGSDKEKVDKILSTKTNEHKNNITRR